MAWVKLDDQAPRNAKVLRAGPSAAWMWVCGIAYCQSHLTEGFIPDVVLAQIGIEGAARARRLAAVLVDVGLFDLVDGGFMVHDYLDHNETKDEALARKTSLAAKRAAAGRAGGLASGLARSNEANGKQTIEAKRSPDPTRPDRTKNPPTPFGGLRRRRRRDGVVGNVCGHEPRCASFTACRDLILSKVAAS